MPRHINGNGKTALTRINEHEKLCRIMQKETFKKIDELSARIERLERVRHMTKDEWIAHDRKVAERRESIR